MKLRRKIRQAGESILIIIGLCTLPFFSRRSIVGISRVLADFAFKCARGTRRLALANLDVAFPEYDNHRKAEIARESFRMFCLTVADMFWFARRTGDRVSTYVKFDPSFNVFFNTAPAITVTGHFGNWEILGLAVSYHGAPCSSVAMSLINPVADRIVNRLRRSTGQTITGRSGAVRNIMGVLKAGGRIGLLMDQNTLPSEGGEFVSFFGLQVPVSRVAEILSKRTGVPVVYAFCTADEQGVYHARAYSSGKDAKECLTGDVARVFEGEIRSNPGQWLWMYKKWKYVPPGENPGDYPFYARPWRPQNGRL